MLAILEAALSDPTQQPQRYSTAQGPAVLFQRPDQVAAVLAETRLHRTDLLPMAFGAGMVVSEHAPSAQRRKVLQRQFGAKMVQAFLTHSWTVFWEKMELWRGPAQDALLCREMNSITLEVICRTVLGVPLGRSYEAVAEAISIGITTMGAAAKLPLGEACLLGPTFTADLSRARQLFDSVIFPLIEQRRAGDRADDDLLGLMVQSPLSDTEIRDEVVSLLLAGSETSALTLSWSYVELSRRPDLQDRLRAEAQRGLGEGPPELEAVGALRFAQAVAEETLRLYPPVWQITRRASVDLEILGEPVEAGTLVIVSPFTVHRDPRNWSKPELFDPDRFLQPTPAKELAQKHLPFSGGRHICLGRRPAMVEVTLLLSLLAKHIDIVVEPGPHEPSTGLTLRHAQPVRARICVR